MNTISIETVNTNGEALYLIANMDKSKVKPFFASNFFKESLSKAQVVPTGNVYVADAVSDKALCQWHDTLPANSTLLLRTSQFDSLAEQYFSLDEKKKEIEKELKFLLKSAPAHLIKGEEYGGYDEFTSSTALSYSELYDLLKQKVMEMPNGQKILLEMQQEEKVMAAPHKGSAKNFKVFRLGVKNEFEKVWRE